jgi:hypothetical protein
VRLACGLSGIGCLSCVAVKLRPYPEYDFPYGLYSMITATMLCSFTIEMASNVEAPLQFIYHCLSSVFFVISLLPFILKPETKSGTKSGTVRLDKPSMLKTILVMSVSYRYIVNSGEYGIPSFTGAMCLGSCLFSLYFLDLLVESDELELETKGEKSKVKVVDLGHHWRTQYKDALRSASGVNIMAGLIASLFISGVALLQSSTLLAWIGIAGVYAFFASVVLRLSQDWAVIAMSVTIIGCLTIYTGMQLDCMILYAATRAAATAAAPDSTDKLISSSLNVISLLSKPIERWVVHFMINKMIRYTSFLL